MTVPETETYIADSLSLRFTDAPEPLPAHTASEGTLLVLGFLAVLFMPNRPSVLLIDDIDRALHPRAQAELVGLLRSILAETPDLQIIATSHSPYLADSFKPEEVVVLGRPDGGPVVARRLSEHPDKKLSQVLSTGEFSDRVRPGLVRQAHAMSLTILHCAEDVLSAYLSRTLLDRVVIERANQGWIRDLWNVPLAQRTQARQYVDLELRQGWSDRGHYGRVRDAQRPRLHPRSGGNAALAYVCVKVAALVDVEGDRLLLLAFDSDNKAEDQRCSAGVAEAKPMLAVVVAEAHQEFDAWVVAGFVPSAAHEHTALAAEQAALNFDP